MARLQPENTSWTAYAAAVALVVGSTGIALFGRNAFHLPDVVMLYLLAILVASFRFGRGPAIMAAALSVATYDFFFVPPFYTFSIEHARHVMTFAMMFGLGLVVSNLAARLKRQEQQSRVREEHTAALFALSRELVGVPSAAAAAEIASHHAAAVFDGSAVVLLCDRSGKLSLPEAGAAAAGLGPAELEAARWANENGRPAGAGTEIFPAARVASIPLAVGLVPLGLLVLTDPAPGVMDSEHRDFLEVFARQIAFGIERVRLAEEAKAATLRATSEAMRSSLLSAISHDLRSPLAAITGAATALRDDPQRLGPEQRAELIDTVCTEAERMERLIANVLDMVRIESGGMAPHRDWVPLEEVLGSALVRLDAKLQSREVRIDLPEGLPLVPVDPVLFEQVFVNLLDNAVKYTPPGSPIEIDARASDRELQIQVADRGAGIPPDERERVFEKFHRGGHAGGGGVGLGLPICRGIVQAHGGTIVAGGREGGGTVFRIRLPLTETPPTVAAETPGEETA
jgi:two-component system sensor histidine kinase KdpD